MVGLACLQGTLTLQDIWFYPFLGLAYDLIVKTIFSEFRLGFFTSNIPCYFLDFASAFAYCYHNHTSKIKIKIHHYNTNLQKRKDNLGLSLLSKISPYMLDRVDKIHNIVQLESSNSDSFSEKIVLTDLP